MAIKIEYENEIPQLRFANIECPKCKTKFDALKNGKTEQGGSLHDYIDLKYAIYKCPHCDSEFITRNEDLIMNGEGGF